MNHQEVSAEDQRKKLPANYEARKRRAEWELEDKKARKVNSIGGNILQILSKDFVRIKYLIVTSTCISIQACWIPRSIPRTL